MITALKYSAFGMMLLFTFNATASVAKCIGAPNIHAITFTSDGATDGSLAIRRSIDGQVKDEMLDDTGYISSQILVASLLNKDEGNPTVLVADRSETVRLLQLRLKKLEEVLKGAGVKDDSNTFKEIAALQRILNRSTVAKENLQNAWLALDKALYAEDIKITAKARASGTSDWEPKEVDLKEFALPEIFPSRSLSCPHRVGDLQLGDAKQASISKVAPSPAYTADDVTKFFMKQKGMNGSK